MTENTIICIKWGDKYDWSYVYNLKDQCEKNCSVPFNFYCITDDLLEIPDEGEEQFVFKFDNPNCKKDIHKLVKLSSQIELPTYWDNFYDKDKNFFWAYRKCYMFRDDERDQDFTDIKGSKFLFLDLDVIIHQDLKYFFDLPMDKPWIVRGWWNDPDAIKINYAKYKSTPLNSSVIRWDRGQLNDIWNQINANSDVIFFTYPSLDNYLNHKWYNIWDEDKGFFRGFPKEDIYSWYKGNIFPDDMELKKIRKESKVCLFNNSGETNDVEELKSLWNI